MQSLSKKRLRFIKCITHVYIRTGEELVLNILKHFQYSAELLLGQSNEALELIYPPLKLQKSCVLCIAIRLNHVHLSVDAVVFCLLLPIGTFHLLLELIFGVEHSILCLHGVHLSNGTTCILLC